MDKACLNLKHLYFRYAQTFFVNNRF